MKTFDMKDKTALVTGANRGIGKGFVDVLLAQGIGKVYAAVRDPASLEALVARAPEVIEGVVLDVTDEAHIGALGAQISDLDVLINNAGIANACFSTADNAEEIARLEMETNFFGPLRVTQALLPALKKSRQAAIINISSIAGISNFPVLGPYSATKAALHSYTQGLRAELAADGIQVLGVYPGPIDTRLTEAWELDKPSPEQVAVRTFEALDRGEVDVLPDDFSQQMYASFLEHPHRLEEAFAGMQG